MAATVALAGRYLRRFGRAPDQLVMAVAFPGMLLLVLLAAFGGVIEGFTGGSYVARLLPGIVTMSIAYGSVASGVTMMEDLRDGFADRVRTMPVGSWALLAARVGADAVRAVLSTVALCIVGFAAGFRFEAGVLRALAFVALAALATTGFGWVALTLGTRASQAEAVMAPLNALFLVCLFLSEGFVPVEGFPGWAQAFVKVNPFTCLRNALGAFADGSPFGTPLLQSLAWVVGLTVVFAPLAAAGYRRGDRRT